jgi:hypothetical protein
MPECISLYRLWYLSLGVPEPGDPNLLATDPAALDTDADVAALQMLAKKQNDIGMG